MTHGRAPTVRLLVNGVVRCEQALAGPYGGALYPAIAVFGASHLTPEQQISVCTRAP